MAGFSLEKLSLEAGLDRNGNRAIVKTGILCHTRMVRNTFSISIGVGLLAILFSACEPGGAMRSQRALQRAENHLSAGQYEEAVRYLETALDGTPATAEVHYRLGSVYDDHLNEPLLALAHFQRYLALAPEGPRADEARVGIERVELAALSALARGNLVTRAEAVHLKNENLSLRQEIARLRAAARRGGAVAVPAGEGRAYKVEPGDTLANISRKMYNTPNRWQDILDANRDQLKSPADLRAGQVLVIP